MSFLENCLVYRIPVLSQYDYSYITNEQGSWCSYEFACMAQQFSGLMSKWIETENQTCIDIIIALYRQCLERGSEKRKQYGKYIGGENINNKSLQFRYPQVAISIGFYMIENESDKKFYMDRDYEHEYMNMENLTGTTREKLRISIRKWLVSTDRVVLVNIYGQSFTVFRMKDGHVIICDSHKSFTGYTDMETAFLYIMGDDREDYKFCTVLLGIIK